MQDRLFLHLRESRGNLQDNGTSFWIECLGRTSRTMICPSAIYHTRLHDMITSSGVAESGGLDERLYQIIHTSTGNVP